MEIKDNKAQAKAALLDELQSIKGLLDEDDDIPVLGDDDDDIPVLSGEVDDDIPVLADISDDIPVLAESEDIPVLVDDDLDVPLLGDDELDIPMLGDADTSLEDKSLQAALSELESLELSPKAKKPEPETTPETTLAPAAEAKTAQASTMDGEQPTAPASDPVASMRALAQRISAARNKVHQSKSTSANTNQKLEEHQNELTLDKTTPETEPGDKLMSRIRANADNPLIDTSNHKENPFLSSATRERLETSKKLTEQSLHHAIKEADQTSPQKQPAKPQAVSETKNSPEEDAADELLEILNEEPIANEVIETPLAQAEPAAEKQVSDTVLSEKQLEQLVDDVASEYLPVLEAALKQKLKAMLEKKLSK